MGIFKKNKRANISATKYKKADNEEIIFAYNQLKKASPVYNEPNYELAKKVFLDFNDFNLINNESGLTGYLQFIPKSLLPYPKNYIKCAYYIYLDLLKKERKLELFNNVREIGTSLFFEYPDYERYSKNLKDKKFYDEAQNDMNPREQFKKLYGVYEVSEKEYNSSPNSIDVSNEELIHDFGCLPEIEEDVDIVELMRKPE